MYTKWIHVDVAIALALAAIDAATVQRDRLDRPSENSLERAEAAAAVERGHKYKRRRQQQAAIQVIRHSERGIERRRL